MNMRVYDEYPNLAHLIFKRVGGGADSYYERVSTMTEESP